MVLSFEGVAEGASGDSVIAEVLESVEQIGEALEKEASVSA